jgi:hypothetical protein
VAAGRIPKNVVNGDVLGTPLFKEKLGRRVGGREA